MVIVAQRTDDKPKRKRASEISGAHPRDRLIAEAAKLAAEKGFGAISVREVCKAAGTGINMIHHYFGNKDGLLAAIVDRFDTQVYAVPLRLLQTPAGSSDDFQSRIQLLFETTLEACLAERDVMMVVIREQATLKTLEAFQSAFVAFLDQAKGNGFVRAELDSSMISGAMLDRIISQVHYAPWILKSHGIDVTGDADYRATWCRANVDFFLRGVLA